MEDNMNAPPPNALQRLTGWASMTTTIASGLAPNAVPMGTDIPDNRVGGTPPGTNGDGIFEINHPQATIIPAPVKPPWKPSGFDQVNKGDSTDWDTQPYKDDMPRYAAMVAKGNL